MKFITVFFFFPQRLNTLVICLPLTIHLKGVGLKKLLISICVTCIVAHVGRGHLGDVQRTIVAKILP